MPSVLALTLLLVAPLLGQKEKIVASFVPAPGNPKYENFMKYDLPHVDAVMLRYDWRQLEPAADTFTWTALDADIARWAKLGKASALIISLVSDSVAGGEPDTSTPEWVLAQSTQVTCANGVVLPVVYATNFKSLSKPFIAALLQHLNGNANVLYVRVGLFEGGENCPLCRGKMPNYSQQTVINYIQEMSSFIAAQPVTVQSVSNINGCAGISYADKEGDIFASIGIGMGMQSLQARDVIDFRASRPCHGDWCAVFKKYPQSYLYLQPAIKQPPSALPLYLPFAESFGLKALELQVNYLDIAYNPGNPNYDEWGAEYRAALHSTSNGGYLRREPSPVYGTVSSPSAALGASLSLEHDSGKVGQTGGIFGQGFTGTTNVSLNGTPAKFAVKSDTYLTATVPAGARTGFVTVTTPGGTLTSNVPFRVTPQLISFDPPSGPVGTVVTITGVSLTQTLRVGFGGRVPASFTVNSDTQVTATVPAGAKTGRVGIETQGGRAISSATFTVTP